MLSDMCDTCHFAKFPSRRRERGETTGSKIVFSLSLVILFNILGVDSCVFLIFTTRVDPNKRNEHRLRSIYNWCPLKNESLSLRFPGEPQKHIRNSARFPPLVGGDAADVPKVLVHVYGSKRNDFRSIPGNTLGTVVDSGLSRGDPGDGRTNFAVAGPGSFWNDFCQIADHLRDELPRLFDSLSCHDCLTLLCRPTSDMLSDTYHFAKFPSRRR